MKNATTLSRNTVVRWDPEQITTEVAGEVLALSIRQGIYLGMDPVASRIWKCLATAQTVQAVCDQVSGQYQGDPAVMAQDVIEFLSELRDFGMLTAREEESAAAVAAA